MAEQRNTEVLARRRLSFERQRLISWVLLIALAGGGVTALMFFFRQLLVPGELGSLSLPIVALTAGLAATFNPCGLPALPGFLMFLGGDVQEIGPRRRSVLSLSTSLGAIAMVLPMGLVVALVGAGTKDLVSPYARWVQLGLGIFLVTLAVAHLLGKTQTLPLVGKVMGAGSQVWEHSIGRPTPKGAFTFGAGYVLVGFG